MFKGPNDLDFDAEGNLFFTDPWGTGPGPNLTDQTGAVYQYSRDGMLRKVMDSGLFPNGIAVSPDNNGARHRRLQGRPHLVQHLPERPDDGLPAMPEGPAASDLCFSQGRHLRPGNGGPDGIHYDVHGNLWAHWPVSAASSRSTRAA